MLAKEAIAIGLMSDFAERTGLTSDRPPKRYLWTDAFALYNWLELYRRTRDERYHAMATNLIDQVHRVLGRHRPDDGRKGWLSGLPEGEAEKHPTLGGLRIGKPLPERRLDEPFDDRLEWERDGQYFHYLTKWIDALVRASVILEAPEYQTYAAEMAGAIFDPFLHISATGRPIGLYWKLTVDLSRPLVPGTNPQDALDGYITYRSVSDCSEKWSSPDLSSQILVLGELCVGRSWSTSDPLGIGGLLLDAFRLVTLPNKRTADGQLLQKVLAGADFGMQHFLARDGLNMPRTGRLPFRELGLAIGLQTLSAIKASAKRSGLLSNSAQASMRSMESFDVAETAIVGLWSAPESWNNSNWQDHRDINDVMLVTALLRAQFVTGPFH